MPSWLQHSDKRPDWASARDEILYVLTIADLAEVFNRLQDEDKVEWQTLSVEDKDRFIRSARKSLEDWAVDSMYNWAEAIGDSIDLALLMGEGNESPTA
jgi:hypothetical protein